MPNVNGPGSGAFAVSASAIRDELQKVLTSQRFRNAEQLRVFLSYVVEQTLSGHGDELKESVIATEAFQRRPSFDPKLDAFVRVQAGRLRTALAEYYASEGREDPVTIQIPKGAYAPLFSGRSSPPAEATPARPRKRIRQSVLLLAPATLIAIVWLALAGKIWIPGFHNSRAMAGRGTIVVAGFENTTGDPVFDGTIRQALLMDLEQSPALYLLPEQRIEELLRLMGSPPDRPITAEIARDLCQRAGGQAAISSSIAGLGVLYVIGLTATDCATGEVLVREQVRASGKERVLEAVDKAAIDLRAHLGESLATRRKYNMPLEQATTPSLKALQAYSEGIALRNTRGDQESVSYFERAIQLDPAFAMAYARLGVVRFAAMEFTEAARNFSKAFALREHVSQPERFYLESRYHQFVSADLRQALAVYQQWAYEFPRDSVPHTGAAMVHSALGDNDRALSEFRTALQINPDVAYNHTNLAETLLNLDRRQETRAILDDMQRRNLSDPDQYLTRYQLAFVERDTADMERQAAAASLEAAPTEKTLIYRAQTEACRGHLAAMHRLVGQAVELATTRRERERAAIWQAYGALYDAELGDRDEARREARSALRLSNGRNPMILAAVALARAGDSQQARSLAAKLTQEFPLDTALRTYWLPVIEASVRLEAGEWKQAIQELEVARPQELGQSSTFQVAAFAPMYPVYLRGEALLRSEQGALAAAEFEKIVNRPGLIQNYPLSVLARLELARAYAAQQDIAVAVKAYREFLAAWKDADPGARPAAQATAELNSLLQGRAGEQANTLP